MPQWTPKREWAGADVIIIGGGPSLRGFNWKRISGYPTIGCNTAFQLGHGVCRLCFFSDKSWFEYYAEELEKYPGRVATNNEEIAAFPDWVWTMPRELEGLHTKALGFGGNTGCGAVNLALLLGARRVLLIGFDMQLSPAGEMHWHGVDLDAINTEVFPKFQEGFYAIARDLPSVFPGREVINCTPGSALKAFPFANLEDFVK